MSIYTVSQQQVKNFLLGRSFLPQKAATLDEYFDRFKCIQVDPIDVVAKSHELALYNRIEDFTRSQLDHALYQDHQLCEYWLQLYSILPTKYFPSLTARMHVKDGWQDEYLNQHRPQLNQALAYINHHGPTSSLDLAHIPKTSSLGSWFDTKSNAALLRFLWDRGQIMVHHRQSTRKYFDLTHRILPTSITKDKVTQAQSLEFLFNSAFDYLGIVRTPYLNRLGYNKTLPFKQMLTDRVKSGKILQLSIPSISTTYYLRHQDLKTFQTLSQHQPHHGLNILPPLDPLIIDRQLLLDIFDFHYRWEAYTPAKNRTFGYYNMPILYNGKFTGQINLRKTQSKLKVQNFVSQIDDQPFRHALKQELKNLENFIF